MSHLQDCQVVLHGGHKDLSCQTESLLLLVYALKVMSQLVFHRGHKECSCQSESLLLLIYAPKVTA